MKLAYITREMDDPRGRPKVFFSCHPADFASAFKLVVEDVLQQANCAIWYDTELEQADGAHDGAPNGTPNGAGFEDELLEALDSTKVNIEYGYCFLSNGDTVIDVLKIKPEDRAIAEEAISSAGFKLLHWNDIAG